MYPLKIDNNMFTAAQAVVYTSILLTALSTAAQKFQPSFLRQPANRNFVRIWREDEC